MQESFPTLENFKIIEEEINGLEYGQVIVEVIWLSLDPYMRGRMTDRKSYVPPFQIDKVLEGGAIGVIEESNSSKFNVGDYVMSNFGWREYFVSDDNSLNVINPEFGPLQAYLGTLGMPGLTAYAGLLEVGKLKDGENVLVSAAAGAVGSIVCQIALAKGCKVYGLSLIHI